MLLNKGDMSKVYRAPIYCINPVIVMQTHANPIHIHYSFSFLMDIKDYDAKADY
jgi:hypothetical protein